ncbi:hypothetical protein PFMC_03083, partial [Plasmodium falciparum CAMP/Malaysia]
MGSQTSKFSKTVVGNETHNSARNVLEKIALETKGDINRNANLYKDKLKGNLSKAKFYQRLLKETNYVWSVLNNPCDLNYVFNTNVQSANSVDRNPCLLRDKERFSNEGEAECNSSRITGNKGECGACAPYRRRHMCDYNLEYINEKNVLTTHDLLGNILVTAKYEGASIVEKHPNRGSSEVCTALARSFADIGDIIRGKDMYRGGGRGRKQLEENLQKIFGNIYNELTRTATSGNKGKTLQKHYKDNDKNFFKLREDWWTANRDQVWKALTCSADGSEEYFKKPSASDQSFSNEQCGHYENNILTNLDYVPQFLRWFNEWAEEFCRVREHKLKKIKEACRGGNNKKECSKEGYDCKKTNIKRNEIFVDLDCPRCEEECTSYNEWLKKKEGEFNKQNNKYEKEIENDQSNSHSTYDNELYNNLKGNYPSFKKFVETLKEGPYCTSSIIEGKIDFNKQYDTFSHSQYCKSCPIFNLKCANGKCNSLDDINCRNIPTMTNIRKQENENPINIHILVNDSEKKELSNDLEDDIKGCDLFKRIRRQHWKCKYKCNLDVCELQNFEYGIDDEKHMLIEVLIKRWLKYFLKDYNKIKEKLNHCINNEEKKISCIRGCYKKCDCVEKWITKKRGEWQNIKDRYLKRYIVKNEDISDDLKTFLKQGLFPEYIKNALDKDETLDKMKETSVCNVPNKPNGTPCKINDVITILLNRLKKKIETCKTQHDENKNNNSCKTLRPPLPRRRRRFLRQGLRSVRFRRPPPRQSLARSETGTDVPPAGHTDPNQEESEEEEEDEVAEETQATKAEEKKDTGPPQPEAPQPPAATTPRTQKNPCVNSRDQKVGKITSVKQVAGDIQRRTHERVTKVPGLTADASKGTYSRMGSPSDFNNNLCGITQKHSNAHNDSLNPCNGKNPKRFNIGTEWSYKNDKNKKTHPEAYMPPRREHICTSNLEYLIHNRKKPILEGDPNKIIHSLLGDVLLAAKSEAEKIKELYQQNNSKNGVIDQNDKETICRSVRYSFADIGDIIKGTDLWEANPGEKKTQNNLVQIFGKIKDELKGIDTSKYTNTDGKHLQLRKDWWEANRDQVWKAMQCGNDNPCSGTDVPLQDYIPQRLRWMTEWAEWYCKYQAQEYEVLVKQCRECKSGKCDKECEDCRKKCKEYEEKIKPWEVQWEKIKEKYDKLYKIVSTNSGSFAATTGYKDENDVVEFLKQLHKQNNGNNIYSTAAGYVHQEAHINDCQKQTQFCNKNSDGSDKNY